MMRKGSTEVDGDEVAAARKRIEERSKLRAKATSGRRPVIDGRGGSVTRAAVRRDLAVRQAARASGVVPDAAGADLAKLARELAQNSRGMREKVAGLESQIRYLERQNRTRNVSLPGSEDGTTFKGKKLEFMYTRAIRFLLTGREEGNELEAEIFRQTEKRRSSMLVGKTALEMGTDSLGGFLVPQQIAADIIELIRAQAVMMAAGVTSMPGLTGAPYQIPKQTSASTAYWVAENSGPTESNQAFGQISLFPHCAAALTKLSKRLIMMASPAAEAFVRDDMSLQLALFLDLAILRGNGASGAPVGIANWPGIGTYAVGTNGGALTYQGLVGIVQKVRIANGLRNAKSVGWVIPTALIAVLQNMVDGNNRPLLLPWDESIKDMAPGEPGQGGPVARLLGYPVYDTTQLPTDLTKAAGTALCEIFFGDIGTVVLGQWGGIEISASDQTSTAFQNRQVWVLIAQEVDVALRQATRMCYCSDVASA